MKYVSPTRLKVLIMMFFATGVVGMLVGLTIAPKPHVMLVTFMGVINVSLGAFFVWIYLVQEPSPRDKRKKKQKDR